MGDTQFQSETQLFERTFFAGETNAENRSLHSRQKTVPDTNGTVVMLHGAQSGL